MPEQPIDKHELNNIIESTVNALRNNKELPIFEQITSNAQKIRELVNEKNQNYRSHIDELVEQTKQAQQKVNSYDSEDSSLDDALENEKQKLLKSTDTYNEQMLGAQKRKASILSEKKILKNEYQKFKDQINDIASQSRYQLTLYQLVSNISWDFGNVDNATGYVKKEESIAHFDLDPKNIDEFVLVNYLWDNVEKTSI